MDEEKKSKEIRSAKDLIVYQKAYALALQVFEASKKFPGHEMFSLTSQIRRSARSVCLNLREAWVKRRYEAHFVSKLSDSHGENGETDTSLDFAKDHGYISAETHAALVALNEEVSRMLNSMIQSPEKFILPKDK